MVEGFMSCQMARNRQVFSTLVPDFLCWREILVMKTEVEQLPIFVYGTLRPPHGLYFEEYLKGKYRSAQSAKISGWLYAHNEEDYPFVMPGKGNFHGELVEIIPKYWSEVIVALDQLEDYFEDCCEKSYYLRQRVIVSLSGGGKVNAWTYFWNRSPQLGTLIHSGNWLDPD